MSFLANLFHQVYSSSPLFILILLGYLIIRIGKWPHTVTDGITRFTFNIAMPIMLFKIMAGFYEQPAVDAKLLIAFFGSCILVFIIGRLIAAKLFKYDGISGSVFALGGIFSNNVFLGIPIAMTLLGKESLPAVALIIAFNGLILWSLVTISVEWSRNGSLTLQGLSKTLKAVLKNPIIIGIVCGLIVSLTHQPLPSLIDQPAKMISQMVSPLSLIALGMGLAEYRISEGLLPSSVISFLKLIIQPLFVWILAESLGLPLLETKAVVLLGSMSIGVNVYLMARQFNALLTPIASSLLISTVLSAFTTPLILTLIDIYHNP